MQIIKAEDSNKMHDGEFSHPFNFDRLLRDETLKFAPKRGRGRPTGPGKKTQMKERLAAAREKARASKAVEPAFSGYHTVSSLSKPKKTPLRQIDVVETYEILLLTP